MPNYALLASGQITGNAAAQQLPQTVAPQPNPAGGNMPVRGEGIRVKLSCTKASTTSAFIGAAGVDATHGFEIPPGSMTEIVVNDTSFIYFFGAATATLTWLAYAND